jgi:SiaC family regulatory phosphoprotein
MDALIIEKTERSPEINFDFDNNQYTIRGESYPEDVHEFYGSVMEKLEAHFGQLHGAEVNFNFELIYFNSSSAKILMNLFELFDETAENGNKVHVTWTYEEDDDNMEELGEEFCEDLEHATYTLHAIEES